MRGIAYSPDMRVGDIRSVGAGLVALALLLGVPAQGTVITASDNAWVLSGSGDQSEASNLTVNASSSLAYLRFDVTRLSVASNDQVYLDLYLSCALSNDTEQLVVAALLDDTSGETTWDSSMTYATRPDGTNGPPNAGTTNVVTYSGRVMPQIAGTGEGPGRRNRENPPGQVAVVIDSNVFRDLLVDDTNNELTLILYGTASESTVASLGSANLKPQLRIVRDVNVTTIHESTYGGQYAWSTASGSPSWSDVGVNAEVGKISSNSRANQFLTFALPKRPISGFRDEDTTLELVLQAQDITGWGQSMVDIWAVGYVQATNVPLTLSGVETYQLGGDSESKVGWNTGSSLTQKIYNNLTSSYASPGRYAIPPDACTALTAYINDLYENHGAQEGDFLILRANPDVESDPSKSYLFYTGDAAEAVRPSLTLSPIPSGTVILLY